MQKGDHDCPLRDDLEILQSAPDADGTPGWIVHDPAQHRYFRIDLVSAELLSLWQENGSLSYAISLWQQQTGEALVSEERARLMEFASANHLTVEIAPGHWQQLAATAQQGKQSIWTQIAHKYLFVKIPLVRPRSFLEASLPLVRPLASKGAGLLLFVLALSGLYLVSRQWDSFTASFSYFFSFEGLTWFTLALVVLKCAHELGHAYMAVHFGCRVPVMGVAFMVLAPMLYTDVSDAWRLQSRRQRFLISAAGIIVELAIAILATFLWVFLPDGVMRSVAFMLATTGWIMSLALNLNPFMRFDGYYLLSDLWGIDNLHPRAFALGRWKLRQWLLAPELAPPEQFDAFNRRLLILYAWGTWIYRLILFTTIALMVYHFAFKLLGILLFALEIWLLLVKPVWREINQWRQIDNALISRPRQVLAGTALVVFVAMLAVPWSSRIPVPAILVASDLVQLYPARPAKITSVEIEPHGEVKAGDVLIRLEAPGIEHDIKETSINRDFAKLRASYAFGSNEELQKSPVLRQEFAALQAKLEGLQAEQQQMRLTAHTGGRIVQIAPDLHPGRWVQKEDLLALVATGEGQTIRGYLEERHLSRLSEGAEGRFVPDDLTMASISVRLTRIAKANSRHIDFAELASIHDGPIAVTQGKDKRLTPVKAQYLVEMELAGPGRPVGQIIRGKVYLQGEARSPLLEIAARAASILIRESGF